jgi:hypothetical protein
MGSLKSIVVLLVISVPFIAWGADKAKTIDELAKIYDSKAASHAMLRFMHSGKSRTMRVP